MKRILVINPITEDAFNAMTEEYLENFISDEIELEVISIDRGPSSIETFYDESFALPEVLKRVRENKDKFDAIVINCFADPAVHAAREISDIPVVGPAEASMLLALTLGRKFGVISTFRNSGPWIELQVNELGIEDRLAEAAGIEIPVLELGKDLDKTAQHLIEAAQKIIEEKGAEVIVLGCTGMARTAEIIRKKLNIPVVEPLAAAFKMAELLIDLNLVHSKNGLYMKPDTGKINQ